MKNILFFGATSKLGKYWIKNLSIKNIVYCNIHLNKKVFKNKNIKKVKINLSKKEDTYLFCKKNNISIIINCIGLANIEKCEKKKKKAIKINCGIPSELCNVSKKLNIPFVHISTDMLFNGDTVKKYDEKSHYNPINVYARTKVKAEKSISKYKKSLIVRANFFGHGEKINQTISDKLIYEQKSKKKSYLWNDIFFTPIYIPNLIYFINLLIKNKFMGIFNISSDQCISKYDFGLRIVKKIIKNNKILSNKFDKRNFVTRPKNMCLSNNKLKRKFKKYQNRLTLNYQLNAFFKDYKIINE